MLRICNGGSGFKGLNLMFALDKKEIKKKLV